MGELSDVDEARAKSLVGERAEVDLNGLSLPADRDAGFEELFRREYLPMLRVAYLLVGSEDAAGEAVHDAFTKVFERWSKIDNHGGYLRTAVVNRCRDVQRRRRRDRKRAETATPGTTSVEIQPLELVDALAKLSPKQREVLVLRFYADLSEAETADHLGIPTGTVKSHVSRGLAELRKVVER